jgi:hypothetical protein
MRHSWLRHSWWKALEPESRTRVHPGGYDHAWTKGCPPHLHQRYPAFWLHPFQQSGLGWPNAGDCEPHCGPPLPPLRLVLRPPLPPLLHHHPGHHHEIGAIVLLLRFERGVARLESQAVAAV